MTRITVAPEWEWWLVWYFFLGGLAAGLYFIAALIELVGSERDRAMTKVAYYCAFPLAVVCGVLLIARHASYTPSSYVSVRRRPQSMRCIIEIPHERGNGLPADHAVHLGKFITRPIIVF